MEPVVLILKGMRKITRLVLLMSAALASVSLGAKDKLLTVLNSTDSVQTVYLCKFNGDVADTLKTFNLAQGKSVRQSLKDLDTGMYVLSTTRKVQRTFFIAKSEDVNATYRNEVGLETVDIDSWENRMLDSLQGLHTGLAAEGDMLLGQVNQLPRIKKNYYSLTDSLMLLREAKLANLNAALLKFGRDNSESNAIKYLLPLFLAPYRSERHGWLKEYETEESFQIVHFWDKLIEPNRVITSHPYYYSRIDEYFMRYAEKSEEGLLAAGDRVIATVTNNPVAQSAVTKHILKLFERNTSEDFYLRAIDHFLSSCESDVAYADEFETMQRIKSLQVGLPAPEITLLKLGGEKEKLSSFKGQPVVLVFWASWCPHCLEELPEIKKQHEALKERNVRVVAVSLDEDASSWINVMNAQGISDWTHSCEFKKWKSEAAIAYNIHRTPTLYVIDAEGIIRGKDVAPRNLLAYFPQTN